MEKTFAMAQAECSAIEMRICTAEELERNKCCNTGCGFDDKLTWHTDSAKTTAPSGEFKVPYFLDIFASRIAKLIFVLIFECEHSGYFSM